MSNFIYQERHKEHSESGIDFSWDKTHSEKIADQVYFNQQYQLLIAKYDNANARILRCSNGEKVTFLPLLIKQVGQESYEAYSAYGYGGFSGELTFTSNDISALNLFLSSEGIIAVFLRHSPYLSNHLLLPNDLSYLNRYTYASELKSESSFENYLRGLPQKLRWSANYAHRKGLNIVFHPLNKCSIETIDSFYLKYAALMTKKATSSYYHFTSEFFQNHQKYLGSSCEFAEIKDIDDHSLGGAFFLLDSSGWIHYHLSAVCKDALKRQGMELLMLSALYRFGAHGYLKLHLGGGHSLDESDGLSRFKSKFAHQKLEYHCSKLICDKSRYISERSRLPLTNPSLFLISDAR